MYVYPRILRYMYPWRYPYLMKYAWRYPQILRYPHLLTYAWGYPYLMKYHRENIPIQFEPPFPPPPPPPHTHIHIHTLNPHFYTVKLGFTGVNIIFLISAQNKNIDCGRGGSSEYSQSMFWAEIWKKSEFSSEMRFSMNLNRGVFVMYRHIELSLKVHISPYFEIHVCFTIFLSHEVYLTVSAKLKICLAVSTALEECLKIFPISLDMLVGIPFS